MKDKTELNPEQIEKLVHLYLLDDKYKDNINALLSDYPHFSKEDFWKWHKSEVHDVIKRAKQIFNNKKKRFGEKVEFTTQKEFYKWYEEQPKKCYYCGTEEEILKELFLKKKLETKRYRGEHLEVDRRDPKNEAYSPNNCVLACYFCNNHKSDIMGEVEFKRFFAQPIHAFLMEKYGELKTQLQ